MTPSAEAPASQHAALCYRRTGGGEVQILLVTSRDTGRWVLPKGWPKRSEDSGASALREAYEEAGVTGRVMPGVAGYYGYDKMMPAGPALPCLVSVHAIETATMLHRFPEAGLRQRRWFSPADAAAAVAEPELKTLLATFRPPA